MTDNTGARALTISAAARMVGVDRRVIRRHLEAGRFSRAERASGESGTDTGPGRSRSLTCKMPDCCRPTPPKGSKGWRRRKG
jgi:hypothetical protein